MVLHVSVEQFGQFYNLRPTILTEEMDGSVFLWLKKNKLERYKWFFSSLSYNEIKKLNDTTIKSHLKRLDSFIREVDRQKICRIAEHLRDRSYKIELYIRVSLYSVL